MKTVTPMGPLAKAARLKLAASVEGPDSPVGVLLAEIADAVTSMRQMPASETELLRWSAVVERAVDAAEYVVGGAR